MFKKEKMICSVLVGLLVLMMAGCSTTTYQPAVVEGGVLSNPTLGWNGYSINMPEGLSFFNPAAADPKSAGLTDFQRWFIKEDNQSAAMWYVVYTERFLFEKGDDFFISLIAETYNIPSAWSAVPSVDMQYMLQKTANRKAVEINDNEALREVTYLGDYRVAYVSGISRPYFRKHYMPLAYEGCFIPGKYREAFWIEGFGDLDAREELRLSIQGMAESLKLH